MKYSMLVRIESEARTIKFLGGGRGTKAKATQQEKQWGA